MNNIPKVSVIIPVYGVEKYIERCARSLFEQTLDELEYIFVDDCTPDKSIEILNTVLQEYPKRVPQVKIVRMSKNGKQAAARNKGLENATGEYVIHCDPDDWVEKDIYQILYNEAKNNDADIAICDFCAIRRNGIEKVVIYDGYSTPQEAILTNITSTPWMLWNRIVRRSLIEDNKIRFFDGVNFMEDRGFLVRCNLVATKLAFVHKFLYNHDCTNDCSISNNTKKTDIIKQRILGCTMLEQWFGNKADDYKKYFDQRKYLIKEDIMHLDEIDFRWWRHTFPELNKTFLTNNNYRASKLYRIFCQLAAWHIDFPMFISKKGKYYLRMIKS